MDSTSTCEAPTGRAERTTAMTPEFYAIIGTAIALAGLILNNQRATAKSIAELRRDLNALGERVARLEGFMQGIRDAIVGKAA